MSFPTNSNTSATGGPLLPSAPSPLPGGLTFEQFLQTVFVGVSGMDPTLVRPKWQAAPPKMPDVSVDWLAFGVSEVDADTHAYSDVDSNGNNVFQRMEALSVQCSYYGPNAFQNASLLRDAFQLGQNREALQSAKMDFVATSKATRAPDLVNEQWVNRWEITVSLRREILRTYPILTFISASGTLYTLGSSGEKTVAWVGKE